MFVPACFPHLHWILGFIGFRFMPSRSRFAILHALLLMIFVPTGDGMSHCYAFGAAHATILASSDVGASTVNLLMRDWL